MIAFYDTQGEKHPLRIYEDYSITHEEDGCDTMTFSVPVKHEQYKLLHEECRVEDSSNIWLIKKIDDDRFDCELDFDFLKGRVYQGYKSETRSLHDVLSRHLPSDWTIDGADQIIIRRSIEFDFCNDYDVVYECMHTYKVCFMWRMKEKRLVVVDPDNTPYVGQYLTTELNLKNLSFKGDTTDFCTRLYCYGKDGVAIIEDAMVDDGAGGTKRYGLPYVEDRSYADKVICAYWSDDRYTVPESMYEDAVEKLKNMANPVQSFECDVVDLAKMSPEYAFLGIEMHYRMMLIDPDRGMKVEHRVVRYKEFPDENDRNTVTLSCVPGTIQSSLKGAIQSLTEQAERRALAAVAEESARLNEAMQKASGLYTTAQIQPDGSTVWLLHDKRDLSESTVVIKIADAGIGLSTDGGKTYPYGYTVTGEMIMDVVAANGIVANWVNAGVLQSQPDDNGERNFVFDLETGLAEVKNLSIRGKNVAETLADTLTSTEQQYYQSDSPTALSGGEWSKTQPAWKAGKYIWNRQYVTYGDGTHAYLPSETGVCISGNTGASGSNGKDGTNGTNGVGVKAITNYYLATSLSSGVTDKTAGWSTNVQSVTSEKPYLWNYEVTAYTDGSSTTIEPHVVGTYGRDGTNGSAGKGISAITEHYLATASSSGVTTNTGGWTETLQQTDTTKRYLWNYETITYTDGSSSTVAPRIIGTHGATGANGSNGTNGVGIESVTAEYILSTSDTNAEAAGTKWGTDMPGEIQAGQYLWTRQKITYTDGNVSYAGLYCMTKAMSEAAKKLSMDDIVRILTNDFKDQGVFVRDGIVYINAEYLRGNTIDLTVLRLVGTLCGIMQGTGAAKDGATTEGIVIYGNGLDEKGNAKPPYIIVTNAGIRGQTTEECNFNMASQSFDVLGNIAASKVGNSYGNITANGFLRSGTDLWMASNDPLGTHGVYARVSETENSALPLLTREGTPSVANTMGTVNVSNGNDATKIKGKTISSDVNIVGPSDRTLKKDIEALPEAYEKLLDEMAPVRFRYKREPEDGPFHMGYIAQDVEAALGAAGLDRGDLAALADIPQEDGGTKLGIAYGELIALLHMKINSLEAEITQLKEAIAK